MNCPYCQNPVHPKAYACGHCGRDLVPWLAILIDQEQLAKRLERIEKWAGLPTDGSALDLDEPGPDPMPVRWHWQRLGWVALTTAVGLLLAHWLLLFVYDAPALVLRVVTLMVPLLVALMANAKGDVDWRSNAIIASLLSLMGVSGMLGVTAWIDGVPWWPENVRDWRETFEYTISILLAWVTGHLIGLALNRGQRKWHETRRMTWHNGRSSLPKFHDVSEQLQKVATAAAPIASGLMAAYSGLKSILGEA